MTAATEQARTLVSRAVVWAGLALGTLMTVLAVRNGIRVPRLEVILSVVATWALLTVFAVVAVELLRRHHRVLRHHGKCGAVAAGRGTRRGARWATSWLASKAGPRWAGREHQPLMFRRLREPADPAEGSPAGTGKPPEQPSDGRKAMTLNLTGRHSGPGFADHMFAECSPGLCGEQAGALARQYATPSKIAPERRARRAAARTGGSIPSEWGPVIAQTADFEPEDDGELLEWMTRQLTGLSAWAEALVDFYEHCTGVIGIDPKASAMLHDVADAAAQAAETMGAAKAKFTEHYELPREFAANGGLMTHDGRWVTGEGA
jgi:hypothetical protein